MKASMTMTAGSCGEYHKKKVHRSLSCRTKTASAKLHTTYQHESDMTSPHYSLDMPAKAAEDMGLVNVSSQIRCRQLADPKLFHWASNLATAWCSRTCTRPLQGCWFNKTLRQVACRLKGCCSRLSAIHAEVAGLLTSKPKRKMMLSTIVPR